jgi:hypothetical protein
MFRLAAFVLSLLLLAGPVDPTQGALTILMLLAGAGALRWRPWRPWGVAPALDMRLASFVLALLLLVEAVDPTRGWLIVMTAVSGVALLWPGLISLEGGSRRRARGLRGWNREAW